MKKKYMLGPVILAIVAVVAGCGKKMDYPIPENITELTWKLL